MRSNLKLDAYADTVRVTSRARRPYAGARASEGRPRDREERRAVVVE